MRTANKARGEVAVNVGGVDLILCAEMARLEAVETETGGLSIPQTMRALNEGKVSVVKAVLFALTVEGDVAAGWAALKGATVLPAITEKVFEALLPEPAKPGNGEAGAADR